MRPRELPLFAYVKRLAFAVASLVPMSAAFFSGYLLLNCDTFDVRDSFSFGAIAGVLVPLHYWYATAPFTIALAFAIRTAGRRGSWIYDFRILLVAVLAVYVVGLVSGTAFPRTRCYLLW